jgi:hypothetical protein
MFVLVKTPKPYACGASLSTEFVDKARSGPFTQVSALVSEWQAVEKLLVRVSTGYGEAVGRDG